MKQNRKKFHYIEISLLAIIPALLIMTDRNYAEETAKHTKPIELPEYIISGTDKVIRAVGDKLSTNITPIDHLPKRSMHGRPVLETETKLHNLTFSNADYSRLSLNQFTELDLGTFNSYNGSVSSIGNFKNLQHDGSLIYENSPNLVETGHVSKEKVSFRTQHRPSENLKVIPEIEYMRRSFKRDSSDGGAKPHWVDMSIRLSGKYLTREYGRFDSHIEFKRWSMSGGGKIDADYFDYILSHELNSIRAVHKSLIKFQNENLNDVSGTDGIFLISHSLSFDPVPNLAVVGGFKFYSTRSTNNIKRKGIFPYIRINHRLNQRINLFTSYNPTISFRPLFSLHQEFPVISSAARGQASADNYRLGVGGEYYYSSTLDFQTQIEWSSTRDVGYPIKFTNWLIIIEETENVELSFKSRYQLNDYSHLLLSGSIIRSRTSGVLGNRSPYVSPVQVNMKLKHSVMNWMIIPSISWTEGEAITFDDKTKRDDRLLASLIVERDISNQLNLSISAKNITNEKYWLIPYYNEIPFHVSVGLSYDF